MRHRRPRTFHLPVAALAAAAVLATTVPLVLNDRTDVQLSDRPSVLPAPSAAPRQPDGTAGLGSPQNGGSPSAIGSTSLDPSGAPTASPTPGAPPTAPGDYQLVWHDEFDGARLDPSKWQAKNNTRVDFDLACISSNSANIIVRDGAVTLRALKQRDTCGSETRNFTTAYLTTQGKQSFTYGRFEVRAKTPNGPTNSTGLWPAFWLRPDDGGDGEIDVVELPGGSGYYQAATQAILDGYQPTIKQDNRYRFPRGYPGDGFHTYTTDWDPDRLQWYVDGIKVYERDASTTPWFDQAFHRPYHLRLNFQVGGWLGNPTASTQFPADFQVDYVRVWQRN